MMTAVSIFSCTNDYDPGLIENLGMKEQPLRIITKVLTTKSPNFMQEFTRGSVIGLHVVSESTGNIYDSNPDYKNVRAEAFLVNNKLNWRQSPDIYLNEEPVTVYAGEYPGPHIAGRFPDERLHVRDTGQRATSGQPDFPSRVA